jgi:hypothetical protein
MKKGYRGISDGEKHFSPFFILKGFDFYTVRQFDDYLRYEIYTY